MRKLLIIIVLFVIPFVSCAKVGKYAFMVGISKYSQKDRRYWNNIHGAEDIYLIQPVLEKQGFNVTSLCNEQATRDGIINGLKSFIKKIHKGDIVYVHFSTHGQPVEDGLNGMGLDEDDGWDESIVPIDAGSQYSHESNGYKGDKHITDDELNIYINNIRRKIGGTGMLYIVMDACHAGELSRGGFETVRGTNEGLTRSGKSYVYNSADKKTSYSIEKNPKMSDVLIFEACTSRERNTEVKIKGKEYGSLSYNIFQSLLASPLDKNAAKFEENVKKSVSIPDRWPNSRKQHLVIEKSF